ELAPLLSGPTPGGVVQLAAGRYIGPVAVPAGVTLRGLGPDRTVIAADGPIVVGAGARIEHCSIDADGDRIAWLPLVLVQLAGDRASLLGCRVAGHVEVLASEVRITSSTATGVVVGAGDRVQLSRSTFRGMHWDCAIDVGGGYGHLIDSCDDADVLVADHWLTSVYIVMCGTRDCDRA